jgi:hypothetical protein
VSEKRMVTAEFIQKTSDLLAMEEAAPLLQGIEEKMDIPLGEHCDQQGFHIPF